MRNNGNGTGRPLRPKDSKGRFLPDPPGAAVMLVAKRNNRGQSAEHMRNIRHPTPNLRTGATVRLSEDDLAEATGQLIKAAPWLQQPRYEVAVEMLTRVLARIRVMDEIISAHPKGWVVRATQSGRLLFNPGEKHYMVVLEHCRRLLNDLGLTPTAAAALGLRVESPDEISLDSIRKQYGAGK